MLSFTKTRLSATPIKVGKISQFFFGTYVG